MDLRGGGVAFHYTLIAVVCLDKTCQCDDGGALTMYFVSQVVTKQLPFRRREHADEADALKPRGFVYLNTIVARNRFIVFR